MARTLERKGAARRRALRELRRPRGGGPEGACACGAPCCQRIREDVARMRVCLTRAMLLLERGCHERAFQGFADIYELAAGLHERAGGGGRPDIGIVAHSLCYLLDRGQCRNRKALEAVDAHIGIVEDLALRRPRRAGGGRDRALEMKLARICAGAQVAAASRGGNRAAAAG